jgi:peptidoglycan/xylan/chitin deacetylase (PgdA/CDA1 family)
MGRLCPRGIFDSYNARKLVNSTFKSLIAAVADRTGMLALLNRGAASNVVFALHRVLPSSEIGRVYNPYVALSAESFEAFLELIKERFQVVSLELFLSEWRAGKARSLATITFDDGWIDNYQYAFPVLRKYRLPGTIFLPTALIGTNQRLPEERIVDLWKAAAAQNLENGLAASICKRAGIDAQTLDEIRVAFKKLPLELKLEIITNEENRLGISPGSRSFINWNEVREMQREGITFGSHTRRHAVLTEESDETVLRELESSRQDLLRETGVPAFYLAYPNGRYDDRVTRLCERAGFDAAFTTQNAFVSDHAVSFTIPRVALDDTVISGPSNQFSSARANLYLTMAARASR